MHGCTAWRPRARRGCLVVLAVAVTAGGLAPTGATATRTATRAATAATSGSTTGQRAVPNRRVPGRTAPPTTVSAAVVAAPSSPTTAPAAPTIPPVPAAPSVPVTVPGRPLLVDQARSARLQDALDAWTRANGLESVRVAIRVAGPSTGPSGGQSWRSSSRADGRPGPDPDARYRVMSITKTVTAALILRAAEAGRIDLDAPLPPLDGVSVAVPSTITVRHLLTHRSGLEEYTAAPGYRDDQPLSPEQAVELSLRAPLVARPGTVTRYVNSNYLLLGLLLQQVHRRPYAELVAELFGPLGLASSRVEPSDRTGWPGFASGGIVGTVADMAAWGDALFTTGLVLTPKQAAAMTATGDFHGGLGVWGVCPCTGDPGIERFTAIGHSTAAGAMYRFPATGITVAMVAEPSGGDTVARAVSLHAALSAAMADALAV